MGTLAINTDLARRILTEKNDDWEALSQGLLEYETLSGEEIKTLMEGGSIDRGSKSGPAIPAAGSSIPARPSNRSANGYGPRCPN